MRRTVPSGADSKPLTSPASPFAASSTARGVLVGTGTVDGEAALARLEGDGKADFDVSVELTDPQGMVVARLVITWAMRRPRA